MRSKKHSSSSRLAYELFETNADGQKLQQSSAHASATPHSRVALSLSTGYQTITGFGGAFTQAAAYLMSRLGEQNRKKILAAYFGESGARYSLTRTHINSCDFSLGNYSYADTPGDIELRHFSIDRDRQDLIPMIIEAKTYSKEGFRIIASPWSASPWMKDNDHWVGGRLKPEYYATWAHFFCKYIEAYRSEGIDVWGVTVENEPLGNGDNWESMLFTPQEMVALVRTHLKPALDATGNGHVKIFGYDQNREHLPEWADAMYGDPSTARCFDGTAVHWYASTYEVFGDNLAYAHRRSPDKYLIQTEACVDAEVPRWEDDDWYWRQEATDWGWDWASESEKHLHPKYTPAFRYASDIIGCLNHYVDGWIDWNMVLDRQGGPNWAQNWCVAPIIVDPDLDKVYFTPLYYVLSHFSRFIRPGAVRIGIASSDDSLQVTAARNPDGSVVVIVFNPAKEGKDYSLIVEALSVDLMINRQAIQTVILENLTNEKTI